MSRTRKRLLTTAALPLIAVSIGFNGIAGAQTSANALMLAQAEAPAEPAPVPAEELPPVSEEPQPAPEEEQQAAPEAPAEPPVEEAPAPEEPAAEPAPAPDAEAPVDEAPQPEAPVEEAPQPEAPAEEAPAPAAEEAPVEESAPAEEAAPAPTAEEAPAAEEEPAANDAPAAESAPEAEAPAQAAPVEEAPANEPASADGAPAEPEEEAAPEMPADEAPVEAQSAPADEAPAEEAPAATETAPAQAPADQAPASEEPVEEQPVDAQSEEAPVPPVEDAPLPEEAPTEETATEPAQSPDEADSGDTPAAEQTTAPAQSAPAEAETQSAPPADAPAEAQTAPAESGAEVDAQTEADAEAQAETQPTQEVEVLPVENGAPVLDSAKEATAPADPDEAGAGAGAGATAPAREPVSLQEAQPQADPEEIEALRQRIEQLEAQRGQRPESDNDARSLLLGAAAGAVAGAVVPSLLQGTRGERLQSAPVYQAPERYRVLEETSDRTVVEIDNRPFVRYSDRDRLARFSQETYYEQLPNGRTREVVVRENGTEVVTIRNRYGDIIQRSRIRPNGEEVVLVYSPQYERSDGYVYRDPGRYLPPLELTVPVDQYIYDSTRADSYEDYVTFFEQPPIEPLVETYTIEEVKQSSRVRDIMPRVDLDNITFAFGSADIGDDQIAALEEIANGIIAVLEEDPSEIFLIEGHTDAVGTDQANLLLSDRRAESVAIALTNVFGIPPENLQTQGYGERYLKVSTEEPERLNRRVAIRRITPLIESAQAQ